MLVTAAIFPPKPVINTNYNNSFYTTYPKNVIARDPELIPHSVWTISTDRADLPAGYTSTADGLFYITCTGNWVFMRMDGSLVYAGGQRRGIPWDKVGLTDPSDLKDWVYKKTNTPKLNPMMANSNDDHLKFVENTLKVARLNKTDDPEINKKLISVALAISPQEMKNMTGYKLARRMAYLGIKDKIVNLVLRHKK